jgi:hypothetical protein
MENGPLVLSANSCNPRDDRALSKNVFPLFALSNRESHTSRFPASLPFNGHKRVCREQCANPEARERRIASNGGDVFQKESILFEVLFRGHRCG